MKSTTLLLKSILSIVFAAIIGVTASGQNSLPVCSGVGAGSIYFSSGPGGLIYKMDPLSPNTPIATTVTLPGTASGLAIGPNLNGGTPSPTYYTTLPVLGTRLVHYWDGSKWVNTTHIMNVDHIGGSCGAIYGLDTSSGWVYKYTGATTATFLKDVGIISAGSSDIAGDCSGSFWVINQSGTPASLRRFDASGNLQQTFLLTGTAFAAGSGGLAINGMNVYYDGIDGKLYSGVLNPFTNTINFSASTGTPFATIPASDFASCGFAGFCVPAREGSKDTIKSCIKPAVVRITATGPGPYDWTVIKGTATISGTGPTVTVTTDSTCLITNKDADCAGLNTIMDTTVIYVASATVDAGPDHAVIGCNGTFVDTLHGTIRDTATGVSYAVDWTPIAGIVSGPTLLNPIVAPVTTTYYVMTVTTISGCIFKDSVKVTTADSTPRPSFTALVSFGCDQDTVRFINTTPTNVYVDSVHYDFGDNITSNDINPTHIYKDQGIYSVVLSASNKYCLDTFRKYVFVLHTLEAEFGVNDDSACSKTNLKFSDKSKFPPDPKGGSPSFLYTFGDGTTSTLSSPTHIFQRPGIYNVRLVVGDYLGCSDTFYHIVVIDSIPFINIITPDTIVCEGQAVHLIASYLSIGNTGLTYNMGDGSVFQNVDTLVYSFAQAGTYPVSLTAHYRICPDTTYKHDFIVRPFPGVNLGPDTVLCPNGSPIALADRVNFGNANAKYLWSTGETSATILAKDIGTYWANVNIGGCIGTDSILVNKDCYVDIPNSFTPNGDGSNDYFLPRQFLSRSLNSFKMSIFNRWGQVIYESSTINGRGWDGKFNEKGQPQGVYVYIIDVTFDNGVKEHYTGNVTLLR